MIIPFELDKEKCKKDLLYYGDKQRYSSMTGIVFINEHLFVCSSFCMREMYLVEFNLDKNTYSILDTIDTLGENGKPCTTDLIDLYIDENGKIELITSDFSSSSISIYELVNYKKLKYIKSITNKVCGHCHGISYYPQNKDIIVFTTTGTKNPYCGTYAINKNKSSNPFFGIREEGWLGKDVTFVNDKIMAVLYCDSAPNPRIKRYYSTRMVIYEVDIFGNKSRKLDEFKIDRHHVDSCIYRNGKIYITIEGVEEEGRIMVFDIDTKTGKLKHTRDIKNNYFFPHGIDIKFGMIAVTEYGRSDVIINKFDLNKSEIIH